MKHIQNIVILGGGTAGWMSAAALAHHFAKTGMNITLVESEQIGTVGVGEASIPHMQFFNKMLGIDEFEFIQKTQATFKLGIEFINWGKPSSRYFHPFGDYGQTVNQIDFHHLWLKAKKLGLNANLEDFCLASVAANQNRFIPPNTQANSIYSTYNYAYHLDAGLYAQFLREYCQQKQVTRIEGKVEQVIQDPATGHIQKLILTSGQTVSGELFIDCSGFNGLLIEQTLKTGYQDWTHWLPCDKAIAIAAHNKKTRAPYTSSTAQLAGWQWHIPLRHRSGNGLVYASHYQTPQAAQDLLLQSLPTQPLSEPKHIQFKTGKRNKMWYKNVVAIGLSSGFLEPLESTSIYLIQAGVETLIEHFPDLEFNAFQTQSYNQIMNSAYQRIRDFLILHYKMNQNNDSDFWRDCQQMSIPDSLQETIENYQVQGLLPDYQNGLFFKPSWLSVLHGQGVVAQNYHPKVDQIPNSLLLKNLQNMQQQIELAAQNIPLAEQQLAEYLAQQGAK